MTCNCTISLSAFLQCDLSILIIHIVSDITVASPLGERKDLSGMHRNQSSVTYDGKFIFFKFLSVSYYY